MRIPDIFIPGKQGKGTKQIAITTIGGGLFLFVHDVTNLLDGTLEGRHFIAEALRSEGFLTILAGFALFFIRRAMANGKPNETPEERQARVDALAREVYESIKKETQK